MPVFGKTLFETVLDSVARDDETEEDDTPAAPQVRGFSHGFVAAEFVASTRDESDPSSLFDDYAPDEWPSPPAAELEPVPAWHGRLSDREIAEDLDLARCRTIVEIRERRRLFALANHPDRIAADYREQATQRMKTANRLIDEALKARISS